MTVCYMEGLALQPLPNPQSRRRIVEIAPATLLPLASHVSQSLQKGIEEFWGLSCPLRLFSIASNPHYYWHMEDFYVAQKGLDKEGKRWAQLRISEGLCQYLFETVLGKPANEADFTLATLRGFEVLLLERFSRKLFQTVSPPLLKQPGKRSAPPDKDPLMHLVWILAGEPEQACQLILTVPHACLKTTLEEAEAAPSPRWRLSEECLMHAHAEVSIRLGTTRARLEELEQLEPGDVVLFENSDARRWHLWDAISRQWLAVAVEIPKNRIIQDFFVRQGSHAMTTTDEMQTKQNIWDNLQVEVTASFNPIKLPLKQVKEMEQGLVVEVGDLMDNRIVIEVEGHPIAWGELLVLGDKFGIRIQGLHEAARHVEQMPGAAEAISSSPEQPGAMMQPISSEHGVESSAKASAPDELADLDLDESDFDDLDDDDEDWT